MPYNSRSYRILIASPSDVEEEREIAVRVIQEWNDLHSYSRAVVLLPLRWETHTAPEYGSRPQEVINRDVVDQCDLLVGVFWTRIGTPTGVAESGTLEEIGRVAKAGKPVMLYFSRIGTDPDQIDLNQLDRLKAFKGDTYPNALTESYKSHIEFRDKFARQLELRVRDLQRADTSGGPPPLVLSIAAPDLRSIGSQFAERFVEAIDVVDIDQIDAEPKVVKQVQAAIGAYAKRANTAPVVLAISNTGSSGMRNLYVEIDVTSSADVVISDMEPKTAHSVSSNLVFLDLLYGDVSAGIEWNDLHTEWAERLDLREGLRKTDKGWRLTFEWPALQPKRERFVAPALFVSSQSSARVCFVAKIFADSLPEPVSLEAVLELSVRTRHVKVGDLVRNIASLGTKPNQVQP